MATANAKVKAVLDYLDQKSSQSVPTGMVAYFAWSAVPSGWLLCNGANVSRTTYANLFAAIGTRFGSGDGSTTFTLPNLNERFIEGTTSTANVGKYIEAGLPNITGTFSTSKSDSRIATGAFAIDQANLASAYGSQATGILFSFNASRESPIYGASSTVQTPALQLLPCIKS